MSKKNKTTTPLSILKRAAVENPHNWELPTASIQLLFKKFEDHNNMQTTEVVQAYAGWLAVRSYITCSPLDLCRLWFVCEMGYATEDEQSELESEYFGG